MLVVPWLGPGAAPAAAQGADGEGARAAAAFGELRAACALDAGALWGRSLCGPLLVVEPATRAALANVADAGGVLVRRDDGLFAGTLPASVPLANTSVAWSGTAWAMVLAPLPADRHARLRLLIHESFHREQPALGLAGRDPTAAHLDERDGRYWLRLELRAHGRALAARPGRDRPFVRDALLFRAARRAGYAGADSVEDALERHEGLAEYTGAALALRVAGEPPARVAAELARFEARPSFVRSFAYATGPALGLLLDRHAPGWRGRAARTSSLSAALATAAGIGPLAPDALRRAAAARAAAYDGAAVARAEDERLAARRARLARLRARLVDGPLLVLRQPGLQLTFDPGALEPLGEAGTVYTVGSFRGPWGELRVAGGDGVLLDAAFGRAALPAPADTAARPLRGDGWVLAPAPGWRLGASAERVGDLTLLAPGAGAP